MDLRLNKAQNSVTFVVLLHLTPRFTELTELNQITNWIQFSSVRSNTSSAPNTSAIRFDSIGFGDVKITIRFERIWFSECGPLRAQCTRFNLGGRWRGVSSLLCTGRSQ
jgi:hypothetical protein